MNGLHTPCFVVHKDLLDGQLRLLKDALKAHWENSVIAYSYKTNALPWLIRYCHRMGCYAEVVSADEYRLGKHIGVEPGGFVYNGPIKTKETFLEALRGGSIVNLDAARELQWLADLDPAGDYKLGIRVNFDIEAACPGQSACGGEGGRFGFCYENGSLKAALDAVAARGLRVRCLHLHTSSKTRSIDIYRAIAKTACEIAEKYGLQLDWLDIGGGFFGGLEDRPQFGDYLAQICPILERTFDKTRTALILEPGMSLIGPAVSYVTQVTDVKDTTYGRFAVTDGSRTAIDPLMTKTGYFHHLEQAQPGPRVPVQTVCGFTCMEHDRLFRLENSPALSVGDRIVYRKVGAYTMCLSPLFIQYFPAVYLEEEGFFRLIRRRWQPEDYCQGEIEP